MSDLKILNYKSRVIIAIIAIEQDEEIGKASRKWMMVFKEKLLLKEQSIIIFKNRASYSQKQKILEKTAKLL